MTLEFAEGRTGMQKSIKAEPSNVKYARPEEPSSFAHLLIPSELFSTFVKTNTSKI